MPSGSKKRKAAKKSRQDEPEGATDIPEETQNTSEENCEGQDEQCLTPKTPVRENESDDKGRIGMQISEWVNVLDQDARISFTRGLQTTKLEEPSHPAFLGDWETVSHDSTSVANPTRSSEVAISGTIKEGENLCGFYAADAIEVVSSQHEGGLEDFVASLSTDWDSIAGVVGGAGADLEEVGQLEVGKIEGEAGADLDEVGQREVGELEGEAGADLEEVVRQVGDSADTIKAASSQQEGDLRDSTAFPNNEWDSVEGIVGEAGGDIEGVSQQEAGHPDREAGAGFDGVGQQEVVELEGEAGADLEEVGQQAGELQYTDSTWPAGLGEESHGAKSEKSIADNLSQLCGSLEESLNHHCNSSVDSSGAALFAEIGSTPSFELQTTTLPDFVGAKLPHLEEIPVAVAKATSDSKLVKLASIFSTDAHGTTDELKLDGEAPCTAEEQIFYENGKDTANALTTAKVPVEATCEEHACSDLIEIKDESLYTGAECSSNIDNTAGLSFNQDEFQMNANVIHIDELNKEVTKESPYEPDMEGAIVYNSESTAVTTEDGQNCSNMLVETVQAVCTDKIQETVIIPVVAPVEEENFQKNSTDDNECKDSCEVFHETCMKRANSSLECTAVVKDCSDVANTEDPSEHVFMNKIVAISLCDTDSVREIDVNIDSRNGVESQDSPLHELHMEGSVIRNSECTAVTQEQSLDHSNILACTKDVDQAVCMENQSTGLPVIVHVGEDLQNDSSNDTEWKDICENGIEPYKEFKGRDTKCISECNAATKGNILESFKHDTEEVDPSVMPDEIQASSLCATPLREEESSNDTECLDLSQNSHKNYKERANLSAECAGVTNDQSLDCPDMPANREEAVQSVCTDNIEAVTSLPVVVSGREEEFRVNERTLEHSKQEDVAVLDARALGQKRITKWWECCGILELVFHRS